MNKRILALILALIIVLGTSAVLAESPEGVILTHKETGVTYELYDVLFDFDLFFLVGQNLSDYTVRVNDKLYDAQEVQNKFDEDPDLTLEEAVEGLDEYLPEEPVDDLEAEYIANSLLGFTGIVVSLSDDSEIVNVDKIEVDGTEKPYEVEGSEMRIKTIGIVTKIEVFMKDGTKLIAIEK